MAARRAHFDNNFYTHGSAELATEEMLKSAGAFEHTDDSIFFGFWGGRPLGYSGHAGVTCVAGPRVGKSRDWAVYNTALGAGASRNRIILDPKGELSGITNILAPQGIQVIVWSPSGGPNLLCIRINPVGFIGDGNGDFSARITPWLTVAIKVSGAAQSKYFEERARAALENICLAIARRDGFLTLGAIWDAIRAFAAGGQAWECELAGFIRNNCPDLHEFLDEVEAQRENGTGGFDGYVGELINAFKIMDSKDLREATSPPFDFSFDEMLDPNQRFAVYLCPQAQHLKRWAMVINSMFMCAKEFRANALRAPRQNWWIDETAQLGSGASFILEAYEIGAGAWGITPITMWQSHKQMAALGAHAPQILADSSGLKLGFGIRDIKTAEAWSREIGQETLIIPDEIALARAHHRKRKAAYDVMNGGDPFEAQIEAEYAASLEVIPKKQHRWIRTPDEVRFGTPGDKLWAIMDGVPAAIYADRRPYYTQSWMAGRYLNNHYVSEDSVKIMGPKGPETRRVIVDAVPEQYADFIQHRDGLWRYIEGLRPS